jgi:hypothetical protein
MIQWQEVRVSRDHAVSFAKARLSQPIQETGEQGLLRHRPAGFSKDGHGSANTHCGIHEILLFRNDSWKSIQLTWIDLLSARPHG